MAIINPTQTFKSIRVRKKWGDPSEIPARPNAGIYRVRRINGKLETEKLPFYAPYDPKTIPQQANRSKFAQAVLNWQGFTVEQKKVYNKKAIGRHMSGYNFYIREYMYG